MNYDKTCPPVPKQMNMNDQNNLDDEVRSEVTFSFKVENLSKLTDSILSQAYYVRNLPWKIMAMRRTNNTTSPPSKASSCSVTAKVTPQTGAVRRRPSCGCFRSSRTGIRSCAKSVTCSVASITIGAFPTGTTSTNPENGYIQNDAITLEVHVTAEPLRGIFWDSKKHTGYVGLKNQGATCYMNSLLQTLYFTNQLRKAVYKMPTQADVVCKSVALALQRVFQELPLGRAGLVHAEFLRVLLAKPENKMKGTEGTSLERTIPSHGKNYIATEILNDDNKYDAGEHGLQKAEKGILFSKFPPFNDRFEFDEKINLDPFLEKPEDTSATYILHAVLVHSGDNHGGHYVNYGDHDNDLNIRHSSNAYMLVYVRESTIHEVLEDVKSTDILDELQERLDEQCRRTERNEATNTC
ncbi:hypothetical protein quinque_007891 [Culex quinquefasciatus]